MPTAHNGTCTIHYETFGSLGDPALLMVNGLGSQCINYHEDWCAMFAARGLLVIRFDNRDMGLSTHFTGAPVGAQGECYTLSDMAADAVAVLDDLDIEAAHIMGLSMGGMIVQTMAIEHPERVLTLTSVMSNTGEPEYGKPTDKALSLLLGPPATDRESAVANALAGLDEWGSPAHADIRQRRAAAERAFDRCFDPAGTGRQFMAVRASGSRADALRALDVPTLVIHGDVDNLISFDGGLRTAELIPGARFELIEGMGHDYPPPLWPMWVDLVAAHIAANS
ncbi:MAG: alpha/beta hydrolase [Ilumatobacteraceae bacterium]|nr:alpha/beta hydrolase [Ilumatobacteraceae bacterium]